MPIPRIMNPEKNPKKQLNRYLRFSGMGIQMGVIIALGAWGGVKLDALWNSKPTLTIVLSLFAVFASLYIVYKEVQKLSDDESSDVE